MNARSLKLETAAFGRRFSELWWLLFALPMLLLLFASAGAAAPSVQIRINGNVSFPDGNPDTTPVVGPRTASWRIRTNTGGAQWTVTLIADDDLRSGPSVIPANQIYWKGIPAWRVRSGTLSTVTPVILAQDTTTGVTRGLLRFYMNNSWNYDVGDYTTTATITVSAP